MTMPILSLLVFIPLAGMILVMCLPGRQENLIRWMSTAVTALVCALALKLVASFDLTSSGMQFVEKVLWISSLNVSYHLGVDGISILMILATGLLSFLACIASFGIKERVKEYFALYLLLEAGMMGTFLALDLFLFYIFWEVVLVPMYFLIGVWGGPRKEYAAIKFFLY